MDQNQNKSSIIKCPHCNWEYLPAEVMMPSGFLGRPESVVRDALGKILYYEYPQEEPCQTEDYICDGCNKPFIIEPQVTYKTKKEAVELDFSQTYVSLLND